MNKEYPTNLTEKQWQILEKIVDPTNRKRKKSLREVMNALLYLIKTGCQWRMLPMAISIHEANIHDSVGAESVVKVMAGRFPRLKKILAAGGYRGETLSDTVKKTLGCEFSIVLRPDESPKKFSVIPKRWIVERSFAWIENFRRVALDYEFFSLSSLAMLQIAFSAIMFKKITS